MGAGGSSSAGRSQRLVRRSETRTPNTPARPRRERRMCICGHTDFGTCVPVRLGGEGQDVGNPEPLLSPASRGPFQHPEDTDAAMADKASSIYSGSRR